MVPPVCTFSIVTVHTSGHVSQTRRMTGTEGRASPFPGLDFPVSSPVARAMKCSGASNYQSFLSTGFWLYDLRYNPEVHVMRERREQPEIVCRVEKLEGTQDRLADSGHGLNATDGERIFDIQAAA